MAQWSEATRQSSEDGSVGASSPGVRDGQKTLGLDLPTDAANRDAFSIWRKQHGR
jgi:hypothetical protein